MQVQRLKQGVPLYIGLFPFRVPLSVEDRQRYVTLLRETENDRDRFCRTGQAGKCESYEQIASLLRAGQLPFVKFQNITDGRWWGKFYDVDRDVLSVKPVLLPPTHFAARQVILAPPLGSWYGDAYDWVEDNVDDIGDALVGWGDDLWEAIESGADWVWDVIKEAWELLVDLCGQFNDALSDPTKKEVAKIVAGLIVVALGGPPGTGEQAIEYAIIACRLVAAMDFLASEEPTAPALPPKEPGTPAAVEGAAIMMVSIVQKATAKIPDRIPSWSSFAVYDPTIGKYRQFMMVT